MPKFDLNAQLVLQGPKGIKQVVSKVRSELQKIDATVSIKIDSKTNSNIARVNKNLTALEATLTSSATQAAKLSKSLNSLGVSSNKAANSATKQVRAQSEVNVLMAKTARGAAEAAGEMQEFGRVSGLAIRRFAGFTIATGAIFGFINAVKEGVKEAIAFERELIKVSQVSGISTKGLQGLTDQIGKLSRTFGVSSAQLLTASRTLNQAGIEITDVKKALEAIAKTDVAPTFDNITTTTEGAIATLRQFKLETKDLESVLSSVNAVAGKFAVESGDIIAAIRRAGGVFAAATGDRDDAKQSVREFIALFTSVRSTTRETAESIATGLRTVFSRLQRRGTISSLRSLGVELETVENKFVGPFEAFKRLNKELKNLDSTDLRFAEIVEELGGIRQVGKIIPAIQQFGKAQEALKVATAGTNSLTKDSATAQEALQIQLVKTRERFLELIRDISNSGTFNALATSVLKLANSFISLAESLKPILPIIASLAAVKGIQTGLNFAKGFKSGVAPPRRLKRGGNVKRANSGGRMTRGGPQRLATGGVSQIREQLRATQKPVSGSVKRGTSGAKQGSSPLSKAIFGGAFLRPSGENKTFNGQVSAKDLNAGLKSSQFKGKELTKAAKPVNFSLLANGLSDQTSKAVEDDILTGVISAVNTSTNTLGKSIGAPSKDINAKFLKQFNIDNVVGNLFEASLSRFGSPFEGTKQKGNSTFDFPSGLGTAASLFGLPGNITTDAKNTLNNDAIKSLIKKVRNLYLEENTVLNKSGAFKQAKVQSQAAGLSTINKSGVIEGPLSDKQKKAAAAIIGAKNTTNAGAFDQKGELGFEEWFAANKEPLGFTNRGDKAKRAFAQFVESTYQSKLATGGLEKFGVDSLLTPGELVFPPDLVNKIGTRTLAEFNATGDSSGLGVFDRGGVQTVPGTGNTDSFPTTLPEGAFVIRKSSSQNFNSGGSVSKFGSGGSTRKRFASGGSVSRSAAKDTLTVVAGQLIKAGATAEELETGLAAANRQLKKNSDLKAAENKGLAQAKAKRTIDEASGTRGPAVAPTAKQLKKNPGDSAALATRIEDRIDNLLGTPETKAAATGPGRGRRALGGIGKAGKAGFNRSKGFFGSTGGQIALLCCRSYNY